LEKGSKRRRPTSRPTPGDGGLGKPEFTRRSRRFAELRGEKRTAKALV
jgi:hypothetical protein